MNKVKQPISFATAMTVENPEEMEAAKEQMAAEMGSYLRKHGLVEYEYDEESKLLMLVVSVTPPEGSEFDTFGREDEDWY